MERRTTVWTFTVLVCLTTCFLLVPLDPVRAVSEIDTLKHQIDERNARLKEIEKEIVGYQAELKKVGSEKSTLQKAIAGLELERKKVQADIDYTQNKISATDLELEKLGLEIRDTEASIELNRRAIEETLRMLHESDTNTLVELLLTYDNLSDFWGRG